MRRAALAGAAACRGLRRPCPALCGERGQHGLYAWQRANRLLSAVPNRLPLLNRAGIDGDREKYFAVGNDNFESLPVAGSGAPSGLEILPSAARMSSFEVLIPVHRKGRPLNRPAPMAVNRARRS